MDSKLLLVLAVAAGYLYYSEIYLKKTATSGNPAVPQYPGPPETQSGPPGAPSTDPSTIRSSETTTNTPVDPSLDYANPDTPADVPRVD